MPAGVFQWVLRLAFATDCVDLIDRADRESAFRLPPDDVLPGLVGAIRSAVVLRQENTRSSCSERFTAR